MPAPVAEARRIRGEYFTPPPVVEADGAGTTPILRAEPTPHCGSEDPPSTAANGARLRAGNDGGALGRLDVLAKEREAHLRIAATSTFAERLH